MGYQLKLDRDIDRLRGLSGRFSMAIDRKDQTEAEQISREAWPLLFGIASDVRRIREHGPIKSQDDKIVGQWLEPNGIDL